MNWLKKAANISILTTLTIFGSPCVGTESVKVEPNADKKTLYEIDYVKNNRANPCDITRQSSNGFLNLKDLIGEHRVGVNLEKVVEKSRDLKNICATIKRSNDGKIFGEYNIPGNVKKSIDITFRYFPKEFFVEISGEKEGSRRLIEKSEIIEVPILKMILVDRDKEIFEDERTRQQQTCYLIEGDEFNHFGYIPALSLVSTGKEHNDRHPGGYTALGYYYVQRKKKFSFNERFNWEMPFALWYEKESGMSEGQNGIHEYHNTPFGREASHGCVREPAEFAKANFNWAEVKTRVIVIGKRHKNENDEKRFDTKDYSAFRTLIDETMNYRNGIDLADYSSSYFSERQRQSLKNVSEIIKKMRQQPFSKTEWFSCGEKFREDIIDFNSGK